MDLSVNMENDHLQYLSSTLFTVLFYVVDVLYFQFKSIGLRTLSLSGYHADTPITIKAEAIL